MTSKEIFELQPDRIIQGDAKVVLKSFPSSSVDLVITSPPYFQQRDYGVQGIGNESTVVAYLENLMSVFKECMRIVKPTGSVIFNLGDKYEDGSLLLIPYQFAYEAIKRTECKLINVVMWEKLNPLPRPGKRFIPSYEPFFIFVKSNDYFFNPSVLIKTNKNKEKIRKEVKRLGEKYFKLIGKSNLSAEQKKIAKKELLETIQEVKEGKIQGFRMKIKGIHVPAFGGIHGGRNSELENKGFTIIKLKGEEVIRDIIESPVPAKQGNFHPAPFPEEVIEKLILCFSKENDLILDPFFGSGTVGMIAKKLNRFFIGIELNPDYCELAEKRIKETIKEKTLDLFSYLF